MEDRLNGSSEEELLQLRNEDKISEAEYEQLHSAMQSPSAPESRANTDSQKCPVTRELYAFRKRVLLTGLVILPDRAAERPCARPAACLGPEHPRPYRNPNQITSDQK